MGAKPLSLIRPPGQGIAISVVPAKAPVSMVTPHINGQKAATSEPLQTTPINLQTPPINLQMGSRPAGTLPFTSRRAELPSAQVTTVTNTPAAPCDLCSGL